MLDLKYRQSKNNRLYKILAIVLVMMLGIISLGTVGAKVNTVEANTGVLKPINLGRRYKAHNASGSPLAYKYLLGGDSTNGYLPNIKSLENYSKNGVRYKNKGWGINTPAREQLGNGEGGRTLTHSVYPSKTGFITTLNGKETLRISGTAVIPQYFHHTKDNHRVAILTSEKGKMSTVKVWEAHIISGTSSASYDFGYGQVDGLNDWRAVVSQTGFGRVPLHVTNDPYPVTAVSAYGQGDSKYFDWGNQNLLNGSYNHGINRTQVSKLAGLGRVGAKLTSQLATDGTYIMDYTAFVVDIPIDELIEDGSKPSDYEFNIVMTMTTPRGHEARIVGQELGIPGVGLKETTTINAEDKYQGKLSLRESPTGKITYTPTTQLLRNFKRTSTFKTSEYSVSTHNNPNPPSSRWTTDRTFAIDQSKGEFRTVGTSNTPPFGSAAQKEVNTAKAKASVDFIENTHFGRGEVWVGWQLDSIAKNQHVYTSTGGAYNKIPGAQLSYRPEKTDFKPVVVYHRLVGLDDDEFKNPGYRLETQKYTVESGDKDLRIRPLTPAELSSKSTGGIFEFKGAYRYGTNERYVKDEPLNTITQNGMYFRSEDLLSEEFGGEETLYIEIYYQGDETDIETGLGLEDGEMPPNSNETSYVVYHKDANTGSTVHNPTTGVIKEGQDSKYVTYANTSQYEYTGRVNINGTNREQNSYRVEYSPTDRHVSITFYYNRKETVTVLYINRETRRPVASSAELEVIDSMNNQRALAKTVPGYRYTNTYDSSYSGSGTGMSALIPYERRDFRVWYEDWYSYQSPVYKWVTYTDSEGETTSKYEFSHYETKWDYTMEYYWDWEPIKRDATVTFYYDWIEPIDSTKRVQGDSSGDGIKPVDTYTNAGIVTERNAQGVIGGESLHATTSAIYNKYEAPIAVVPVSTTLNFYDNNDVLLTSIESETNDNRRIYNDEYAKSIKVDGRIGNSTTAGGNQPRDIILGSGNGSYVNVPISTKGIEDMEELQKEAEGISGANRQNRERDYVGRWVDSKTNISNWTPSGTGNYSSVQGSTIDGVDVKDVAKVEAEYNFTVYNRIKHNYTSRVGSDGIEYYEYTGSTLMPGYYSYNGNTRGSLVSNGNVTQVEELDVSDIVTDEYVDSEGFNIGAGQVATAQFKIATEIFEDGGSNIRGYMTDTIPVSRATNPIISESDTDYREVTSSGEKKVDYYEEFAYLPYHTEEEVMTQQAVPVGGRLVYVNPYDYFVFPTVTGERSVMWISGKIDSQIKSNANSFKSNNIYDSELVFDPTHSGHYMSEVDDFEAFVNSIADVTDENKGYMQDSLRSENEFNPTSLAGKGTANYKTYNQQVTSNTSRYSPVGSVESSTRYNKRLPVTYVHNVREFMLEDVVAVGKDTGYPVVSSPETIEENYVERYTSDNGAAPSDSDKLITTNNGSIYLIPLNNEGQSIGDKYYTRLFVNGIGNSQFNLVEDNEITFEKYLYGRGNNVIYSGEREEVEVDGEFTKDQKVGQNAKPETTKQVNGTRTSNNKEVNVKVLDDE